ncbi:MAG: DUF6465 family protein [Roseburia sp.]|nr:DUF6465 family protein [Roseburia sp.]
MKDAGGMGDTVTDRPSTKPAASVKKAVAKVIAAEKRAAVQGKEIVSGQMKLEDLEQERLSVKKTVEKKTVTKKPVEKKEAAVKSVSAAKVVEAVNEEKPVEEKKPETKTAAPKAKPAAKATASKAKTTGTKAAKSTTKAAKEPAKKVVIQYHGNDLDVDGLMEKVKAAYVAEGNSAAAIKSVELYIKPEENMVYYVIDGYASGTNIY